VAASVTEKQLQDNLEKCKTVPNTINTRLDGIEADEEGLLRMRSSQARAHTYVPSLTSLLAVVFIVAFRFRIMVGLDGSRVILLVVS
jgi:hypothetical protein